MIDNHFSKNTNDFHTTIRLSRFINYLKGFKSPHLDIAFSAERSIQDAIEELSEAETSTVLISYGVMFLYVAIALGNFKSFRTLLV